jgi:flagellar hook-associated protein 3 FlgL
MRITTRMLSDDATRQLQASTEAMSKAQEQVATTKRLNRPSDDPSQARTAVNLREAIAELTQYQRNIDVADRTLSATDAALGSAGEILQRARELSVQGANGSLSPLDRQQLGIEVGQLLGGLVEQANAKSAGSYLFSGFRTDTAPYVAAAGPYLGDHGVILARTAPNTALQINVTADVAFGPALAALSTLQAELAAGTPVSGATITAIDGGIDAVIAARGQTGARQNRIEETSSFLDGSLLASQKLLSGLEDADMTEAISNLSQRQATYEAALRVNARVMQTTLLDVLR